MPTARSRTKRIADALRAYGDKPGPKETLTLEWRDQTETLPVVQLRLEDVLLNSRSHRLRAQLEGHARRAVVENDPWGDEAQAVTSALLQKAHRDFAALKANLRDEGQRDAGVVTREAVLYNGNTRVVALRELNDESKARSWIRVAVLPADADEPELAELELRLQVQKELKDPYTLTNELLFIEDLTRTYRKTPEQVATDLRWASDGKSRRGDAAKVEQRRRILSLIREMQAVPTKPIELTFFDDKLEQLRALETKYSAMVKSDPEGARRYRDNWLVVARAGSSSVHDLRAVSEDFVADVMRPHLEGYPGMAEFVEGLLAPSKERPRSAPPGVDMLDGQPDANRDPAVDVRRVLDVFSNDSKVTLRGEGGKDKTFTNGELRDALSAAAKSAILEVKLKGRRTNRLEEPLVLVREATQRLRSAKAKYMSVVNDLGAGRRGKFQYQVGQAKKALVDLEGILKPPPTVEKKGNKKRPN